ncbi:Leucine-rich repeat flightless-interacting protein 1/2 [Trinorchestia longiramus]|nr:Leucine-rich repeat flightless-interacting protein 1/2 [Trinorchestia longiramus]
MSRFFSFMKKKGDKDGEMPVSPPPSPLAKSKSESEGKSVKQVKKRSNKRERRKRPAAASEEGSSLETEPCELISTDANGNSMTGKVRSSSNANAGEMVLRITAAEGDCDSLGDVDSISEEEIVNGKMSHSSLIPHVQTQAVEASSEKPPDDLLENASQDAETKVKEINDLPQIKVEKVSCSGTNDTVDDLMDDFMNEAFDDLETDIPSKDSPHVSEEETKTDNNVAGLNGGGPATVLNETPPQEENTEKGDICSKKDNFDDHSVLVRPLSTDTAVTHYSSCEPGSDVFDSASEEFHDALQHGPVLTDEEKVPFQNAALRESGSLSPEDFGEVIFRKVKQNAASNESYDGDDVNKTKENNVSRTGDENLGICFEVASQGRASFLVEDIIEARNQICQEPPPVSVRTGSPASKRDPSIDLDKHDGELIDNLDRDIPSSKLKNSDSDLSFSGSVDPVTPIKDDENSTLSLIEDCPSGGNAMQPMECAVLGADPSFAYDKEDLTCRPVVSEQVNKPSVDEPVSSHTDLCSNSETSGKDNEVTGEQVDGVNIEASKKVILSPEKCENEADKVLNSVNFPSAAESTISDEPIKIDSNVTENDTYSTCVKQASLGDTARLATNDEVSSSSVDNQKGCSGSEDIATTRKFSLCSNSGGSSSISCTEVGSTETSARDHKTDNARSSSGVSDDTSLRSSSRSSFKKQMSLEEELSKYDDQEIKKEAEARLAQRRAARAEARELRLRELEKQQQQNPENNDDASDMSDGGSGGRSNNSRAATTTATANNGHHHTAGIVPPPPPMPHYTRHSSEESNPDDPAASKDIRELEEKFRGAMISNAQLDNEKSQLTYQVELLKDFRADITEQLTQLKKEHKKKCSEHEQLRKVYAKLQEESRKVRRVLEQRDELIQEYGLVVVGGSTEDEDDEDDDDESDLAAREETEEGLVLPRPVPMKRVLLSQEAAEILEKGAAKGSLEWRLRRVVEHKRELEDELRRVNLELEEQVNNQRQSNCLDSNIQKEANKTVNEYKFKVQRAEAEVSSLQANVNRLEVLVTRYKTQVEELEKSEEELKLEKRKLQRELRDAQGRLEELETTNSHLLRRFEKLKNARSNLLKDLSQDPV